MVAPNGASAAFTVTWHGFVNRMKAAGMTQPTVANNGANEASRELYRACGFPPLAPDRRLREAHPALA